MCIAKDAVDADILVNNGATSISRAPRDVIFCKPLYKFSVSFSLILNIKMIFNCHRYDFLPTNYEIVGECSPTNVVTFQCGDICGYQR